MNRADLMRHALRSGDWRSRLEIFRDCDQFFLTNNAASELRARGFTVEQRRIKHQFQYRLLGGAESRDSGHETARKPLSRIALRSSEQAALPTAGKPLPQRAACSPIQLEQLSFGSASGDGAPYASGESRAA